MTDAGRIADLLSGKGLRTTPYVGAHLEAGAVFYSKGGWLRPLHYGDPVAEQRACREAVALFDVHSMGKMSITGREAGRLIERVAANRPPSDAGEAVYTTLCDPAGRMIDDLVVYRCSDEWFIICNTVSRWAVAEHLAAHAAGLQAMVRDVTAERAYIALQGPRAWDVLSAWLDDLREQVRPLGYYACVELDVAGHHSNLDWCLVCRTGYTGELGFELIVPIDQALAVWQALRELGAEWGLRTAGGTALQALRTEKGYRGFGADIDRTMTPAEAGLGWTVRVAGRSVVGQERLEAQASAPADHCRVWPVLGDRGVAVGAEVIDVDSDDVVGRITSSAYSPTLDRYTGIARMQMPGWPDERSLGVRTSGSVEAIEIGSGGFLDPARDRLKVALV